MEHSAEIERDLFGRRWVVRVRYRAAKGGRWSSFLLVPEEGEPFDTVCEKLEAAIVEHRRLANAGQLRAAAR